MTGKERRGSADIGALNLGAGLGLSGLAFGSGSPLVSPLQPGDGSFGGKSRSVWLSHFIQTGTSAQHAPQFAYWSYPQDRLCDAKAGYRASLSPQNRPRLLNAERTSTLVQLKPQPCAGWEWAAISSEFPECSRSAFSERRSELEACFTMVNGILGAGVLGYPFAFKSCGLVAAAGADDNTAVFCSETLL